MARRGANCASAAASANRKRFSAARCISTRSSTAESRLRRDREPPDAWRAASAIVRLKAWCLEREPRPAARDRSRSAASDAEPPRRRTDRRRRRTQPRARRSTRAARQDGGRTQPRAGAGRSAPRALLLACSCSASGASIGVGGARRLLRRATAADRSARGAEAAAQHRHPGRRRHAARQSRRHRRRGGPLADLPPYLPKAFVAIEDRRFYSHFGIDPIGIARALVAQRRRRAAACRAARP